MPTSSRALAAALVAFALASASSETFAQLPPNMRTYVVALMKKGPAWSAESTPQANEAQQGDTAFLQKLEAAKTLIAAGPVNDSSELAAVLVLDVATAEEGTRVLAEHPAVKAGRLAPHVLLWYAEKGIGDGYVARKAQRPGEAIPLGDYQFGLLMRGSNTEPRSDDRAAEVQKGHIANLEAMHAAGLLVAAGPFGDGGDYRGIVVFRAADYPDVFDAVEKDPAVRAGRLFLRLYRWRVAEGVFKP